MKAYFRLLWTVIVGMAFGLSPIVAVAGGPVDQRSEAEREAYFLIRYLECLWEVWPQDISNPDEFVQATAELRKEALKFRVRSQEANLPKEIPQMYIAYVTAIENYTEFLQNIGAIKQFRWEEVALDSAKAMAKGMADGVGSAMILGESGVDPGTAATIGPIIAGISAGIDIWKKSRDRQESEVASLKREVRSLENFIQLTLEGSKQRAQSVASFYKWHHAAIGWSLDKDHAIHIIKLINDADCTALLNEFDRQSKARPFDPFIRAAKNEVAAECNSDDAELLLALSLDTYELSKLVPRAAAYDDFRIEILSSSAAHALGSREMEVAAGLSFDGTTLASKKALQYCQELKAMVPNDPSGWVATMLAMARLLYGDTNGARIEIGQAFDKLKHDANYQYICACILSISGDYDTALKWLAASVEGGYDILEIKSSIYLSNTAKNRADYWKAITSPRWSWTVKWGIFSDDIILHNNSAFALTNVKLDVHVVQDNRTWKPSLNAKYVGPKSSYKFSDIFSIPGDRVTGANAVLNCDQCQ